MQEYETVKGARAMLQASQASAPSERTVAGYVAKTAQLFSLNGQALFSGSQLSSIRNEYSHVIRLRFT